jgi:hypothetical protein
LINKPVEKPPAKKEEHHVKPTPKEDPIPPVVVKPIEKPQK